MTPEIINLIFPNPLPTPSEIEAKYPPRQLPEGAKVTRVAPSPTGFMHIGGIYAGLLSERIAHQSGGKFYLRIEDTDQKRKVDGAVELISNSLGRYGIHADEGVDKNGHDFGSYGPYTQSQRKDIYQAYVKDFLEKGLAYPCFCAAEDLDIMRKIQEKTSVRPGYYGKYAKCRNLTDEQILENLKAGKPFVIRFKSNGDNNKRMMIKDLIKGDLALPENDIDIVIMKSDGLPTYHFAHLIDDHLMGTTHVTRGDEWVSSVPLHIQLFASRGWKAPKYAHFAPLQKSDNGNKRKLSKRHDPEANIMYFWEKGYPENALIEYLLNLINASFEDWRRNNPDKNAFDFPVNFNKISNAAGALFDFVKLNSISKDVVAAMSAEQVFEAVLKWAKEYNPAFATRLEDNRDYVTKILNIERNIGKKSRKDLTKWEDVESDIAYFFDDLFQPNPALLSPISATDVRAIADEFMAAYHDTDDKDTWFAHIKSIAERHGFATDMKVHKENPSAFKGNVSDVAKVLRVLTTGRDKTPDLYQIMQILGVDRIKRRLSAW
ncbi:MAG: glutamate--tRNA ligase [Alphaproteobacteria bacterium]|nr:glutamate--tRNA ligase [Alphaproteobacteria bacterium]